jgi:uncharacterized Tic20 family protein
MTATGKASQPRGWFQPTSPRPTAADERLGALSYLGAIVLGPLVPLVVYLARRRRSPFVRQHAAQALNVTLTGLLYAVSGTIVGVMLSFDSGKAALAIMVPIATIGWLIILTHLVRGAVTASRGDFRPMPAWICSPLVK